MTFNMLQTAKSKELATNEPQCRRTHRAYHCCFQEESWRSLTSTPCLAEKDTEALSRRLAREEKGFTQGHLSIYSLLTPGPISR